MEGFIQAKLSGESKINEGGEPVAASVSFGKKIECRYISTLFNQKGRYEGGTFTQSAYEIIIENMDFNAKTIRLIDSRGNQVCEKDIQSLEVLETIQRIKITI